MRPAVVGAVIDLSFCLNLLDGRFVPGVRDAYDQLVSWSGEAGVALPQNTGGRDRLRRQNDCAVIRTLHQARADAGERSFDTVRAAFTEGDRIYPTAGFAAKTHIQVCVRDPACVKGYFRPVDAAGRPIKFD